MNTALCVNAVQLVGEHFIQRKKQYYTGTEELKESIRGQKMRVKWKRVNPGYHPVVFQVFREIIKHDKFKYNKKRIEEEFEIRGVGKYKLVCKWHDEMISSFNMYRKFEKDLREPEQVEVLQRR